MEQQETGRLSRAARIARAVVAGATMGILAVSSAVGVAPGEAATTQYTITVGGWEVGGFLSSTGHLVYCIEPGAFEPSGQQLEPRAVETLPGFSAQQRDITGWDAVATGAPVSGPVLQRMNWLLTTYGQTQDANVAAAVQFALWMLREDPGLDPWTQHHAQWLIDNGAAWHIERAQQMVTEAKQAIEASAPAMPEGELVMSFDADTKNGTVSYPEGTERLRITGGVFESGEQEAAVGPDAGALGWVSHENSGSWRGERTVSVTGEWSQEYTHWPAAVMLHESVASHEQNLGSMMGPVDAESRVPLDPVSIGIAEQFEPVLTTQTAEFVVRIGEGSFTDRVNFGVSADSRDWATRQVDAGGSEYAPVIADGVLYGPFDRPQQPQSAAPAGAPVAARASLTADRGPGEYEVNAHVSPSEPGYYYWVWEISEATQSTEIREAALLPPGYTFADRFGLAEESHFAPLRLRWSTALVDQRLTAGSAVVRDAISVTASSGEWLFDETGDPVTAHLRLTVYSTEEKPQQQATVPEAARVIAEQIVAVTEQGTVSAEPIELPRDTRGWVTARVCLVEEDQPNEVRGVIEEWCDNFGVPEETAQIMEPVLPPETRPAALAVTGSGMALGSISGVLALVGLAVWARGRTASLR